MAGATVPPETRREIIRLYKSGLTLEEVGERVHWHRTTIRGVL